MPKESLHKLQFSFAGYKLATAVFHKEPKRHAKHELAEAECREVKLCNFIFQAAHDKGAGTKHVT